MSTRQADGRTLRWRTETWTQRVQNIDHQHHSRSSNVSVLVLHFKRSSRFSFYLLLQHKTSFQASSCELKQEFDPAHFTPAVSVIGLRNWLRPHSNLCCDWMTASLCWLPSGYWFPLTASSSLYLCGVSGDFLLGAELCQTNRSIWKLFGRNNMRKK